MNQISPAATGTAGVAIAGLTALIGMASDQLKLGISPQDQVSIASAVVVTVHWAAQQIAARRVARAA